MRGLYTITSSSSNTMFVSRGNRKCHQRKSDVEEVRLLVQSRCADDTDPCTHVYCYNINRALQCTALNNGYTILRDALHRGYVNVAKAMLSFGAPVNDASLNAASTPLHHAALGGYATIVELLLSKGALVNAVDSKNRTPLHLAVQEKRTEDVVLFLSHDANVNSLDDSGESALHRACCNGSEDIVKALLSVPGIDINHKLRRGKTPLHLAIDCRSEGCALAVVECGADVNIADDTGGTPLYYAANNDLGDTVLALLGQGAAVNCLNHRKKSPLHLAVQKGHKSIVSTLLKHGAKTDLQDDACKTPLHFAAPNGSDKVSGLFVPNLYTKVYTITFETGLAIFAELLDYGAAPNIKDNGGRTALHIASAFGNGRYVALLLENAAEINLKDDCGNTALHYASSFKYYVDLMTPLLSHGADVNSKNRDGKTALHIAATSGDVKCVSVLLELGAEVNLTDDVCYTALHYAASRKKNCAALIITSLLNYGAAVNSVDRTGKTALHIAASIDNERCVVALLKGRSEIDLKDAEGNSPLGCAVTNRCDDTVSCLLNRGGDVNYKNGVGKSVLHTAVEKGFKSIVSILLKHVTVDVNAKDMSNNTPLHIAAKKNDAETVINLLTHRADIDGRGNGGKTALYQATEESCLSAVEALLEYGADVNITRDKLPAFTPVKCAQDVCSDEIFSILLKHIVVLKLLNFPLNKTNSQLFAFALKLPFYSEYVKELTVLEISRLEKGPNLSLYEMLILKNNDLLVLVNNKVVSEYLTDEKYEHFTNGFKKSFALQFRLAKERATLLREVSYFLGKLFSIPPGICVLAITEYLSNRDLSTFIAACRITGC